MACELCDKSGGELLWQDELCRVVRVDDADYPGFCRVIWQAHIKEMTDLPQPHRQHLMRIVFAVEEVVRQLLRPGKINLASLGNVVPHLHWHVIPRWRDDRHFPAPIWAAPQRAATPQHATVTTEQLRAALAQRLQEISS